MKVFKSAICLIFPALIFLGCSSDAKKEDQKAPTASSAAASSVIAQPMAIATVAKEGEKYFTVFNGNGIGFLKSGWSGNEPTHTWSDGKKAIVSLPLDDALLQSDIKVTLETKSLGDKQSATFVVNGKEVAKNDFKGESTFSFIISKSDLISKPLLIEVDLPDAKSPKELKINDDARVLALALKSITVSKK